MGKKKKVRTEFRKNREVRTRQSDWTHKFQSDEVEQEDAVQSERISGKGELTRKRTILADEDDTDAGLAVDEASCLRGRVLNSRGLYNTVEASDGRRYECTVRRLLKTLSTDQRHVVAAGDHVLFRPSDDQEGMIVRVEPRHGVLSRQSRGRQHIIVTNVDRLLIVASAAEPYLKPHLIDRFLVSAEKAKIEPVICINKVDLVDLADLQPIVGTFAQLGYQVLLLSAQTGHGIDRLRRLLADSASALAGQSGVGKSSLLNAIEPGLGIRVRSVSQESHKGRHTTTSATLWPLSSGGYVVDTPGIRQFGLWDIIPEEVDGYFRDLRPFVSQCRFPDCTHTHEEECAVKDAVADDLIDERRYDSYCHLRQGDDI